MKRQEVFARILLVMLTVVLPSKALACPACLPGDDVARIAYLATTIFLSSLPVAMVFGVAWWIRRRTRHTSERLDNSQRTGRG